MVCICFVNEIGWRIYHERYKYQIVELHFDNFFYMSCSCASTECVEKYDT